MSRTLLNRNFAGRFNDARTKQIQSFCAGLAKQLLKEFPDVDVFDLNTIANREFNHTMSMEMLAVETTEQKNWRGISASKEDADDLIAVLNKREIPIRVSPDGDDVHIDMRCDFNTMMDAFDECGWGTSANDIKAKIRNYTHA